MCIFFGLSDFFIKMDGRRFGISALNLVRNRLTASLHFFMCSTVYLEARPMVGKIHEWFSNPIVISLSLILRSVPGQRIWCLDMNESFVSKFTSLCSHNCCGCYYFSPFEDISWCRKSDRCNFFLDFCYSVTCKRISWVCKMAR